MSDLKFSCPQCQQHIQCEDNYAGLEITCPACSARMMVPGVARTPPPPPPPANACPSCGAGLAVGAVLCTSCGYNLRTGQRTQTQSASRPGAARPKPARAAASADGNWFKTPYPYLAAFVGLLATLYLLARGKPDSLAMLAFAGLCLLYLVAVQIIVIVCAFKESMGVGFLTLCIPIYAVYFVYRRSESPTLMALYAVSLLINIALYTFKEFQ